MRTSFQPVLLAAWGMQTAGVDIRHSPKTSTPEARKALLDEAMKGVNEARAQLIMESDVRDVFDEFDRVRSAKHGFCGLLSPAHRLPPEV